MIQLKILLELYAVRRGQGLLPWPGKHIMKREDDLWLIISIPAYVAGNLFRRLQGFVPIAEATILS